MKSFLTILDKCQNIASFWMLFSIWERPCVQKEIRKPNSKNITRHLWIKYQKKFSLSVTIREMEKWKYWEDKKKLLEFWEDGQYILMETIVESLMSIQRRVLKYWADTLYVPSILFFSSLWSVPVFIEVDFCQQRRSHEIEQKKNISLYFFLPFTLWPQCI